MGLFVGSPSISIPGPGMNFYKDFIEAPEEETQAETEPDPAP